MAKSDGKPKGLRLTDAVNDLVGFVTELTGKEALGGDALERVFGLRERLVLPVCQYLEKRKYDKSAKQVMALFRATEEYAVCFGHDPDGRDNRRSKIEVLARRVRRDLLGDEDRQGEMEKLLDDVRQWQWKATLDANGRIAFATGTGVAVPARASILREVGPKVIDQAIKAQRPYSDVVRPRDVRNEPGGLVNIKDAKRLIVAGDLHGRYDNLEAILRDKDNLKSIVDGEAHLVFVGDAVHPASSRHNTDERYEDSFAVMLLIMTLKAENPSNVHYIIGNHDNAHAGGWPVGKKEVRQDSTFEKFIRQNVHASVLERYREFVLNCPVAVRAHAPNGAILIVHATLSDQILNEEGYINVFLKGRRSKALEDLLWSRDFDPGRIEDLAERVGARFVIGGHTAPTRERADRYGFSPLGPPAFGQVGHVQLIVSALSDVFGYMDIDLTRRLPRDVGQLMAPDGKPACRMLQPRKNEAEAAEGQSDEDEAPPAHEGDDDKGRADLASAETKLE